jgi:hypothetical protein
MLLSSLATGCVHPVVFTPPIHISAAGSMVLPMMSSTWFGQIDPAAHPQISGISSHLSRTELDHARHARVSCQFSCLRQSVGQLYSSYHHSDLIKCQYHLTFDTSWIYAQGREDVNPWKILPLR